MVTDRKYAISQNGMEEDFEYHDSLKKWGAHPKFQMVDFYIVQSEKANRKISILIFSINATIYLGFLTAVKRITGGYTQTPYWILYDLVTGWNYAGHNFMNFECIHFDAVFI